MKTISDRAHELAKERERRAQGVREPDYAVGLEDVIAAADEYRVTVEERLAALELVNSPDEVLDKPFLEARERIRQGARVTEHRFKVASPQPPRASDIACGVLGCDCQDSPPQNANGYEPEPEPEPE